VRACSEKEKQQKKKEKGMADDALVVTTQFVKPSTSSKNDPLSRRLVRPWALIRCTQNRSDKKRQHRNPRTPPHRYWFHHQVRVYLSE
jgi:hypothetical protein